MRVYEIQRRDSGGWLDTQLCVLWRDLEHRQSSLSCTPPNDLGVPAVEQPGPRD